MESKVVNCTCKNAYQDDLYGYGKRIANEMKNGQLRCTVCNTICGGASITKPMPVEKINEKTKEEPKKEDKSKKPKPNKDKKFGRK